MHDSGLNLFKRLSDVKRMWASIDPARNPFDKPALKIHDSYDIFLEITRRFIMPSKRKAKIILEVMYKADYCLPCFYMEEMVRLVLPKYADRVEYRRVDFLKGEGKERFLELSQLLFGEEGVYKHCRLAPVPSLWINGELFFDAIPPQFELEEALDEVLAEHGDNAKKEEE